MNKSSDSYFIIFETSEQHCRVVLTQRMILIGDFLIEQPRRHGDVLIEITQKLLADADIKLHEITAIGVTVGPGAFTGIRIGVSMAQGIAYGLNIPCLALNTLELWAEQALYSQTSWQIALCLMDARMNEVYVAAYARFDTPFNNNAQGMQCILEPKCCAPALLGEFFEQHGKQSLKKIGLIGSGARVYGAELCAVATKLSFNVSISEEQLTSQACIRLVNQHWDNRYFVSAQSLDALYLRPSVLSENK